MSHISSESNTVGAVSSAKISFEDTATAFSFKSDYDLRKSYLLFATINQPWLVGFGTASVKLAFNLGLPIKSIVKHTIFSQFCGGEDVEDCGPVIRKLAKFNVGTILDYSVEGEKSEEGFDKTEKEILETIYQASESQNIPFCVFKVTGIAATPLLAKVQSGEQLTDTEVTAWKRAQERVHTICETAFKKRVRIFIDAEETWIQGTIDDLAMKMMALFNLEQPIVYNTYQMYVASKLEQLKKDVEEAKLGGFYLGAKLVRGAYMEKERERAEEKGYPDPIQPNKEASDRDFDEALRFCVENRNHIAICAGTHNEQSSLLLTQLMEEAGIAHNDQNFYFAQLFGMSDHISFNLAKAGYNVAKYVPYGPVKAVMPYLFRRAEENTSIAGQSSREFILIKTELARRKKSN